MRIRMIRTRDGREAPPIQVKAFTTIYTLDPGVRPLWVDVTKDEVRIYFHELPHLQHYETESCGEGYYDAALPQESERSKS